MRIEIIGRPEFHFVLVAGDLAMLIELSAHHYDGWCRSASKHGGFLYGWENCLDGTGRVEVTASWREVDTCCKIMESACWFDKDTQTRAIFLSGAFRKAFYAANGASARWKVEVFA